MSQNLTYHKLVTQVNNLKTIFLSAVQQNPMRAPTKKETIQISAFIILVHAEIETFIESLALDILCKGEKKWLRYKIANKNIASLFIKADISKMSGDIFTRSCNIITQHKHLIKRNHGIKSKNLDDMFCPLGYLSSDFDSILSGDLDFFGSLRGDRAHNSIVSVQQQINLVDLLQKTNNLLILLENFETYIKTN